MSTPALSARDVRLKAVKASPLAVADHDRARWLSLFAAGGAVEDPKGIPPHEKGAFTIKKGQRVDDLGLFYDNFIAPNAVRFDELRDVIVGDEVVRHVVIRTTLSTGLEVSAPSHLFYTLVEEDGGMKVSRLEAFWEARGVNRQATSRGFLGYRTLLSGGLSMLRSFGLAGMKAYNDGLRSRAGRHGKATVTAFADALNAGDAEALVSLFARPDAPVEMPVGGGAIPADELLEGAAKGAHIELGEAISCSWWVTVPFELHARGERHEGVARFEFDSEDRKIASARLFWEA